MFRGADPLPVLPPKVSGGRKGGALYVCGSRSCISCSEMSLTADDFCINDSHVQYNVSICDVACLRCSQVYVYGICQLLGNDFNK